MLLGYRTHDSLPARGDDADDADLVLVDVAVSAEGRRTPASPVLNDEVAAALARVKNIVVILDHAGPRAALWSKERPIGPTAAPEPKTSRRPRPLDEAGWERIRAAYVAAAECCRRAGLRFALGVDNDGLLHAALAQGCSIASEIHRALGPIPVALVVEELCPGGLDLTDGISNARAFAAQGAPTIYASAGSALLPALRDRKKGTAVGDVLALESARWLLGRVDVPIVAVVPRGDPRALASQAAAAGLAGIVVERGGGGG